MFARGVAIVGEVVVHGDSQREFDAPIINRVDAVAAVHVVVAVLADQTISPCAAM